MNCKTGFLVVLFQILIYSCTTAPIKEYGIDPNDQLHTFSIIPDTSLEYQIYLSGGIPPVDKAWSCQSYKNTFKFLNDSASKSGTFNLPRYQSPRSGKVFAKMTDKDLISYMISGETIQEKILQVSNCMMYFSGIYKLYFTYMLKFNKVLDTESALLTDFNLSLLKEASILTDQFMEENKATINASQRSIQGLATFRNSQKKVIWSLLKMLGDQKFVRRENRLRFANAFAQNIPVIIKNQDQTTKSSAILQLRNIIQNEKDQEIRKLLASTEMR